jgi:hypothetical protein
MDMLRENRLGFFLAETLFSLSGDISESTQATTNAVVLQKRKLI